jgi:sulfite reductase (ferredoxin)
VWLAGCPAQTRLAQVYTDRMHINDLETFFTPILEYFKRDRKPDEGFGDFCNRVGLESIREVCQH